MPIKGPTKYWNINNKKEYNLAKIKKRIHDKELLRKIFMGVAKFEPAFAHEIIDYCDILNRGSFYNGVSTLSSMGIINRISIREIDKNKPNNWLEEQALIKWGEFSNSMPKKTKDYFYSKTGIYYITEIGIQVIDWAFELEGIKDAKGK